MRVFGSVIQVAAGPVFDVGQESTSRNAIGARTIGDEAFRLVLQALKQALEEALGSDTIPFLLHQDVQHRPVLIHGTPKVVQHAVQANKNLFQMLGISGPRPAPTQSSGKLSTEFAAPMADAFVGDHDAALGQDQLDVAQAEAEEVVQPHGVVDDRSRKAMARI